MTFLLVEAEIFYLTRFERTDDFAAAIQQLVTWNFSLHSRPLWLDVSLISGVNSLSLCRFASASMQLPEWQEILLLYHICSNILRLLVSSAYKSHSYSL